MKLASKISISRIILSLLIILLLVFPFESAGIEFTKIFVNELIVINVKYLIAGVLFIIAALTDYFDDKIAKSKKQKTEFSEMLDSMATKVLTSSILIILASQGFIHPIIPIIITLRDSVVNSIKMYAGSRGKEVTSVKTGKIKDFCLTIGIVLTLFYNIPFELINIKISDILIIVSTVLSVVSGFQYYNLNKELIKNKA